MRIVRFYVQHTVLSFVIYSGSLYVVLISAIFFLNNLYPWIAIGIGILWITLCMAVFGYIVRRSRSIANACTPEEGIKLVDSILQGANLPVLFNKKYGGSMARAYWIDRGTYLFLSGRFDEAIANYAYLEPYRGKIKNLYMLFIYDTLLQIAAIQGNLALAQYYFDQQAVLLQDKAVARYLHLFKIPPNQVLCSNEAVLALYGGDYVKAEALMQQLPNLVLLKILNTTLVQVNNAYLTGLLYYHLGNFAEASPNLQFAAQNGGTTFYRTEAEKLLLEMQMVQ